MEWMSIEINKQNIKAETDKAVLINLPHKSNYDGFAFWHPAKLVRLGSNSYARKVSFTNDFIFKLKKYGQGKYNGNEIIDEREITVEELREIYGSEE